MTQAWRAKKYHCIHLKKEGEKIRCALGACNDDDVLGCCGTCPHYQGRDRGLGDTIKRATEAVGIKPCGGCQKRREALNKLTEKLYSKGKPDDSQP